MKASSLRLHSWAAALILGLAVLFPSVRGAGPGSIANHKEWRPEKRTTCDLLHPVIEQLTKNLTAIFAKEGINIEVVDSLHNKCEKEATMHACIKAQKLMIKDGVVYVTNLMPVNGFGAVELIGFLVELYEVSQLYKLPDLEFAYWHDDNPPAETNLKPTAEAPTAASWPFPPHKLPPILAWATFPGNGAMVVPYSGAFRCPKDSFDVLMSQMNDMMMEAPWDQREKVGFGRWNVFCAWYYGGTAVTFTDGSPVPCPREYLSNLYKNHTDKMLTAALGHELAGGAKAGSVPLNEQYKYRYIVSTDGWSISSKFDKYLVLGSLILKARGFVYGWYYPAMEEWVHYVPYMVKHKDDIIEMIDWARANDDEAHKIAQAAQTFALRNLNRSARLCYIFRLLSELGKHMKYTTSCDKRKVCVPLVEELKFLATWPGTHRNCKYDEVLSTYGRDDPAALPGDSGYKVLLKRHEDEPHHVWGRR
ncbi:hypothetical protein HYH03_007062 [Edaphochlamys debaryana]|uniref:Glycosyl transferase CAP10 domain-containing protein n=1 Tax=Edaphochlamys debaryana TaxID=47281 RepID=A0A835Y2M6_9CHLO|nr:hypothetical protein HYH03_007062 [Edaphochlamys debaryana]|eukprot:KAG2494820.1 hypothetical protein HYH03_007062 [Edaphochlamys debaryana]